MQDVLLFALLGLGLGALYSLCSQGLIVIYRGAGVLNLALGATGMIGVYTEWELHNNHGVPFIAATIVGVLVSAVLGALTHLLIMRHLVRVSPFVRVVATLGVLLTLQSLALLRYGSNGTIVLSDLPTGIVHIYGEVVITWDRIILLIIAAVVSLGLWALYRFTTFGLGTAAVAENQRSASSLGWSPDTIATINWALGSALAGFAAILIAPIVTLQPTIMTNLILAATAAALVAGFTSFPVAFFAGLLIGIVQTELEFYVTTPGIAQSIPFVIIVAWLALRGRALPLRDYVLQRLPSVGNGVLRWRSVAIGVAVTVVLICIANAAWLAAITVSLAAACILLSLTVLTGYTGQLSLGQFALAGFGAWVTGRLNDAAGIPFWGAFAVGVAVTVPLGLIFALPAVRTRGVNLAIVTLGLGTAVELIIFDNTNYTGGNAGTEVGPPRLFGWDISAIDHPVRWAILSLVFVLLMTIAVSNLRRGRTGRRMIAVRTNERAAAALGIGVTGVKLYAFGLSAGFAAIGGILLAYESTSITYTGFDSLTSVAYVGYAMIGGIGYLFGPILGSSMATGGLGTQLFDEFGNNFGRFVPLVGGISLIVLVLLNQNGMARELGLQMRWVRSKLAKRAKVLSPRETPPRALPDSAAIPVASKTLEARDVTVHYGGTVAVNRVSLSVRPGRVTGLIGPNGAGKTSLIDAVSGLTRVHQGQVLLDGRDVSRWSAARRARDGLGRSFQSLELFEDSTVLENLEVASDERNSSYYLTDLFTARKSSLPPAVVAAVKEFGLESKLDRQVTDLSFGERRLLAIARAVAGRPSVLLLDEPAAGLGDVETAELGRLVRRLADEYEMAIMVVEHDMNFVMAVCDEIVVLDFGNVIATGRPDEVRRDAKVIAAYLGEVESDASVEDPLNPGLEDDQTAPSASADAR
jgi:ABC-type branched-subunit amino acid transport system ATPase component/ABC-type branched-subunit amino acid transport system permease subunit